MEVAAYYVVSEALTNTAKHAHASVVRVAIDIRHGVLELSVRDDAPAVRIPPAVPDSSGSPTAWTH